MFQNLQNLGWGLVGFALIIGIGTVILHEFGGAIAKCPSLCYNYNITAVYNSTQATCVWDTNHSFIDFGPPQAWVYNGTLNQCTNSSNVNLTTPHGAGWSNTNFLITELGSAGLAGWVPAIIAVSVGMLLFGAFLIGNKGDRKY